MKIQSLADVKGYHVYANVKKGEATRGHKVLLTAKQNKAIREIILKGVITVEDNPTYEVE